MTPTYGKDVTVRNTLPLDLSVTDLTDRLSKAWIACNVQIICAFWLPLNRQRSLPARGAGLRVFLGRAPGPDFFHHLINISAEQNVDPVLCNFKNKNLLGISEGASENIWILLKFDTQRRCRGHKAGGPGRRTPCKQVDMKFSSSDVTFVVRPRQWPKVSVDSCKMQGHHCPRVQTQSLESITVSGCWLHDVPHQLAVDVSKLRLNAQSDLVFSHAY